MTLYPVMVMKPRLRSKRQCNDIASYPGLEAAVNLTSLVLLMTEVQRKYE